MSTHLRRGRGWLSFLAVLYFGLALWGCGLRPTPETGAVVLSCDRAEAGDVAGLRPGDVVVAWSQAVDSGTVDSPFRLAAIEQDRAPYGPVELTVRRGWRELRVVLPTGRWRVHLRPVLDSESLTIDRRARDLLESGQVDTTVDQWRALAATMKQRGRLLDGAWFHLQAGTTLATVGELDESASELQTGADEIDDERLRAAYWELSGNALLVSGHRPSAAHAFNNAVEILEDTAPGSPGLAFCMLQFCRTDLRGCGDRGDRILEIYGATGRPSIELALAHSLVGSTAFFQSELDRAEDAFTTALGFVENTSIGSPITCDLLGNLGLVAMRRGDLDGARRYFRRDIEIAEKLGPDTPQYSHAANYLGLLSKNLGRWEEARLYYEQALEGFRETRPGGVEVAGVLTNLANVALLEGNLEAARRHHEEALLLRQVQAPGSADVAASLHNVGLVARWQGDLKIARTLLEEALSLKSRFGPGSAWMANTLFELGEVARADGRLEEAENYHLKGLETYRRIAPRHPRTSASLHAVGAIELMRGRPRSAEDRWREAIAIIEENRQRMQISDEERSRFGARYYNYYGSLARLFVDEGRGVEAWDILERARAVALRKMVARRGAAPTTIPSELWFEKNRLDRRVARIEGRIARIDPIADEGLLHRYREQLDSAESQLATVMEEIREAAPRFSAFSSPEALTYRDTIQALEPGTVVISYSLGEERSMALVVAAGGEGEPEVQAFPIPMGAAELSRRLNIFHSFISRGQSVTEEDPAFITQARKLFNLLVGPAFEAIAQAERVLIIPDGPLVDLPFAALVLPRESVEYLGHFKPLFFNSSTSVFVGIKELRGNGSGGETTVVAFGDPDYPPQAPLVERYRLDPLPGSRVEVESIERLFGSRATTHLGVAATEDAFKNVGGGARVMHCALHAVSDPRFPMESALFFSIPEDSGQGAQDGVLWAWEVADELDIHAEVVVLSACSTARGRAVEGEGVFGLARAFQYAGVSTLVASQWEIPDRSTAELMAGFYAGLERGLSTSEALRVAQLQTASEPATAHPFHWASFQVRGDWR